MGKCFDFNRGARGRVGVHQKTEHAWTHTAGAEEKY